MIKVSAPVETNGIRTWLSLNSAVLLSFRSAKLMFHRSTTGEVGLFVVKLIWYTN